MEAKRRPDWQDLLETHKNPSPLAPTHLPAPPRLPAPKRRRLPTPHLLPAAEECGAQLLREPRQAAGAGGGRAGGEGGATGSGGRPPPALRRSKPPHLSGVVLRAPRVRQSPRRGRRSAAPLCQGPPALPHQQTPSGTQPSRGERRAAAAPAAGSPGWTAQGGRMLRGLQFRDRLPGAASRGPVAEAGLPAARLCVHLRAPTVGCCCFFRFVGSFFWICCINAPG